LVKANAITKTPLPFESIEKNEQFVALFSILDDYSKSIFINRIITEKNTGLALLPLMKNYLEFMSEKERKLYFEACTDFNINVSGNLDPAHRITKTK